MNRISFVCTPLICLLLSVCTFAQTPSDPENADTLRIPLDKIWGFEMPGTRDVQELEPSVFGDGINSLPKDEADKRKQDSLLYQIYSGADLLKARSITAGPAAEPAFAVRGAGIEALRETNSVLVGHQLPLAQFTPEDEVTAIFFSHQADKFVHLQEVSRSGNVVTIRYQFVPHAAKNLTSHFALIPLGKLPVGEYQVEIIQSPMDSKFTATRSSDVPDDEASRIVSRPFSFRVKPVTP